ncbi:hypothetical protein Drorol1_Dr00008235 [Drosera rotundifolia]
MKKKLLHVERSVFARFLLLFFALQIAVLLIIRTSRSNIQAVSHEHETRSRLQVRSSASNTTRSRLQVQQKPSKPMITCDRSHRSYNWCRLKHPTILEPTSATFFMIGGSSTDPPMLEKIRPYPLKQNYDAMLNIREITLTSAPLNATCQVYHSTPALAFSIGGFTGNFFHDFNDGFLPLFITINTLFPEDQDITLVITNYTDWWYSKYEAILPRFSAHPIVNLDNQTVTHCFPSGAVGLITHGSMTIKPRLIPNGKTFLDFHAVLEEGYGRCLVWPPPELKGRPRLILVGRKGNVGRVILNQDRVIRAAEEAGFEVVVFEPTAFTYLCDIYRLINGSHAMVGVHGAALTHSLFLRPGSVFIQVVPLGNDWLAGTYFKNLAVGLKLEYMEYKIRAAESSLALRHGMNHVLIKDSKSIASRNWSALHKIYLKGQDVRLDIGRFKGYLRNAYRIARRSMLEQGLHVKHRARKQKYIEPLIVS